MSVRSNRYSSVCRAFRSSGRRFVPCVAALLFLAGAQAAAADPLADGRQWEQVSPQNKEGSVIEPIFDGAIQAAADGLAFTYVATAPIEGAEGYNGPERVQFYSQRGSRGWTTRDIDTPHSEATRLLVGRGNEYRLFSPDLASAIVEPSDETLLAGATEYTMYRRERLREPAAACTPCYIPLLTSGDVEPPGVKFGEPGRHAAFIGATGDLKHVVFRSEEKLTSEAAEHESDSNLYEWNEGGGAIDLVSVLPNGKAAAAETETATLGDSSERASHSISSDGTRVVWEAKFSHTLYLRDLAAHKTIAVSEVSGGTGGGGFPRPTFQAANTTTTRIFFTDEQRLTANSAATFSDPELFVFEVTSEGSSLAGKLTDLTPPKLPSEAVAVQGRILGTSEDGSVIYYVARGALTEVENSSHEKAISGDDNLYVQKFNSSTSAWEQPDFVARLSETDQPDWLSRKYGARSTASVSQSGRYLAFMSNRSLTDYNNLDATTGTPDEEVFLYDGSGEKLACVSCDPSGARPEGYLEQANPRPLVDKPGDWEEDSIAANLPDWVAARGGQMALYQPRYLSNSGRLFFNSFDGLAQTDTNGNWDVYEYEPPGIGSCAAEAASYDAQAGGCVSLISSGLSVGESTFLDASETGGDAFVLTSAKLVPQDLDTALDVYDAHQCIETVPCPPPSQSPLPCETASSCRDPGGPPPQALGAPASVAFSGPGNALEQKSPAAKSSRMSKLHMELAACRKHRRRKVRQSCEVKIEKLLRAVKMARQKATTGEGH